MKSKSIPTVSKTILCAQDTLGVTEQNLPEFIRHRAYQLFEARERQSGHELDDWLQAEREIKHHSGFR